MSSSSPIVEVPLGNSEEEDATPQDEKGTTMEKQDTTTSAPLSIDSVAQNNTANNTNNLHSTNIVWEDIDEEDENVMIEIPIPGLPCPQGLWPPSGGESTTTTTVPDRPTRMASGICTICLSSFTIGSTVVWSSNPSCEHVFHEDCIEKWLLKQREGPLCPCCRRDFIVDPDDVTAEDQQENEHDSNNDETFEPPPESAPPSRTEQGRSNLNNDVSASNTTTNQNNNNEETTSPSTMVNEEQA